VCLPLLIQFSSPVLTPPRTSLEFQEPRRKTGTSWVYYLRRGQEGGWGDSLEWGEKPLINSLKIHSILRAPYGGVKAQDSRYGIIKLNIVNEKGDSVYHKKPLKPTTIRGDRIRCGSRKVV